MAKKSIPFLDLKPVNLPFEEGLIAAATDVIRSGRYLHGTNVEKLESQIASICGTKHAIAVSNGLDALRLIIEGYKALGRLKEGDEVIVQANTYIASALAISQAGLTPIFADIAFDTLNLDTSSLERLITPQTRAIMPVHLYGTPCFDETLLSIAARHSLLIIEDNAQALGAKAATKGINGSYFTGGLGHASGCSFYPTKNLGALGDAGIVTTSDTDLASAVSALANYGSDSRYHNIYKGFNCRMDELQAAMLLVKLPHLCDENTRRREIAECYVNNINTNEVITPCIFSKMHQVWHQFPLRVEKRSAFQEYMADKGIGTDILYPSTVYNQPCYADKKPAISCRNAELFAQEVVCLPIGAHITKDDVYYICDTANKFNK